MGVSKKQKRLIGVFILVIFFHLVLPVQGVGSQTNGETNTLKDEENSQTYTTYLELDYTEFRTSLLNQEISEIRVFTDGNLTGKLVDGRLFNCVVPDYKQTMNDAVKAGVQVKLVNSWWSGASGFFIAVSFGIFVLFLIGRLRKEDSYSGSKSINKGYIPRGYTNYGKTNYHPQTCSSRENSKNAGITFADIAGVEEIMVEINEIVDYIKNPAVYNEMGVTAPKGVLLAGPPGVGKTLIARAVAGESGANFIFSSASEFDERYVGVGASRIRNIFTKAKSDRPAIIFIDEIDTIGYKRYQSVNNSYEQTLNQLLTEMDGFEKNTGIVVMAATNRIDVLDEALLRPGRFDRHIIISKPDLNARLKILGVHSRNKKLSPEAVDSLPLIAAQTFGFSGADLANLLNEAGFHAIRRGNKLIEKSDLESALERIIGGISSKVRISSKEKNIVAHHEAGHALAAYLLSEGNPVTKISIISRGGALGYVSQLPSEDTYILTEGETRNKIKIMLAGRVAEELVYEEISTGAQNDLEQANALARRMVCDFGMGPRLKNITWNNTSIYQQIPELVSGDIRRIIDECYQDVKEILKQNYSKLLKLGEVLLVNEVLTGEELEKIIQGKFSEPKPRVGRTQNGIGVAINGLKMVKR